MKIPEGTGFTAYDYADNRTTPFAFRDAAGNVLGLEQSPPEIDASNPEAEEPLKGSVPSSAPLKALEKARKKVQYEQYEPQRPFPRLKPLASVRELDDAKRTQSLKPQADGDSDRIRSLELPGVKLDKGALKALTSRLGELRHLTHLTLRGCGIKKVTWSHRSLRYIDYSENAIGSTSDVILQLAKSPLVEQLLMAGNPVCSKKDFASRVVATLPRLTKLDTVDIDAELRLRSLRNAGTKFQRSRLELVRWDLAVCDSPALRQMTTKWQADLLTTLHLVDAKLTEFHVGCMVGLRDLNLARNEIASTLNAGLEVPPKLKRINLSSNRITSHKMFKPLPLCASLLSLSLKDNREGSKALANYRALVIFTTRHLAGTNRANGLQELDGKPVSIKERVDAVSQFEKKKKDVAAFAVRCTPAAARPLAIAHRRRRSLKCTWSIISAVRSCATPSTWPRCACSSCQTRVSATSRWAKCRRSSFSISRATTLRASTASKRACACALSI